MDIFLGYAGVAVAFGIMMFVLMMIFIRANNISWKLKLVLIPFIMWYSVALYHIPQNFMGWPAEKWSIQNEVIILSFYIVEKEAFYFTVVDYNFKNLRKMYDARTIHTPYIDDTPRLYKVTYNSDLHKNLLDAKRRLSELGRGGMTMNMDMLPGMSRFDGNSPLFKIFDPADALRKIEEEQ
jgi:hypothetical protein